LKYLVSSYFHDIGWRERADWLITDWLGAVPNAQPQSLGGNYGELSILLNFHALLPFKIII